jgi:hypothetical protein
MSDMTDYELGYAAGMRRAAVIAEGWNTGSQAAGDIRREANRYESIARNTRVMEHGGQESVAAAAAGYATRQ